MAGGARWQLLAAFVIALLAAPSVVLAEGFQRGINLTGWFTWPRYVAWDKPGVHPEPYPPARHAEGDAALKSARKLGFRTVRIGVDPAPFMGLEGAQRESARRHVLETARKALALGLDVIFDLHPNSRHKIYGQYAIISGVNEPIFQQFLGVITEFSADLAAMPSGRVALELMNEPRLKCAGADQEKWNVLNDAMIAAARRSSARLPLIVTGACVSSMDGLLALDPGRWKDSNIYYTFHFYDPFVFTHQSAFFIAWPEKYLRNLPWPPKPAENVSLWMNDAELKLSAVPENTRGKIRGDVERVLQKYLASGANRAQLEEKIGRIAAWADKHGVARKRILIGEFGVWSVPEPASGAACKDRAAWVRDVREIFDKYGFIWTFFHYDGPFGILRQKPSQQVDQAVLKALGLADSGNCPA